MNDKLFDAGEAAEVWTRLRGGCGGRWRHNPSGWIVMHCGHPTALWLLPRGRR